MKNPADTAVEMLREIAGESRATDKKKLLVALAATIENELSRLRAAADNAGHALAHAHMYLDDDEMESEVLTAIAAVRDVLQPNAKLSGVSAAQENHDE